MVSGDVFRTPRDAISLCVQVGSGVQIISSATLTLFFAALGMLFSHRAAVRQFSESKIVTNSCRCGEQLTICMFCYKHLSCRASEGFMKKETVRMRSSGLPAFMTNWRIYIRLDVSQM